MTLASPWWTPSVHADRRPRLLARNAIKAVTRDWFGEQEFVEVETAALQVSPGNEAHLAAFATVAQAPDGSERMLYMHTSPEFSCKKLLAAGEARIFSFGPVYRNRERGALHSPEFTMLEWYRADEPYQRIMEDCVELVRLAASKTGATEFSYRNRVADPFAQAERLTLAEAFERFAGIDLLATMDGAGNTDREALFEALARAGIRTAPDDVWADLFSRVMVERVEPRLGIGQMTILYEYPAAEAALAQRSAHDPRVSERFELYCCGVELANGFGELTDAAEQRRRFTAEMDEKERVYGDRYPLDEDFLAALDVMPEASGVALGFDRLVMLATGARSVDDVIWTPVAS